MCTHYQTFVNHLLIYILLAIFDDIWLTDLEFSYCNISLLFYISSLLASSQTIILIWYKRTLTWKINLVFLWERELLQQKRIVVCGEAIHENSSVRMNAYNRVIYLNSENMNNILYLKQKMIGSAICNTCN